MVIVYKTDHAVTGSAKQCWAAAICFCFATASDGVIHGQSETTFEPTSEISRDLSYPL